jgi:uncharacterized protein
MPLQFSWDLEKAKSNEFKHGVSFEEAVTIFRDPLAAIFADPEHSADENREIIVGYSAADILMVVSFVETGNVVRIISARTATRTERKKHEETAKS